MTHAEIWNEIARIDAAGPCGPIFAAKRIERVRELRAMAATLPPEPVVIGDAKLDAMLEAADASSAKNRRRDRYC